MAPSIMAARVERLTLRLGPESGEPSIELRGDLAALVVFAAQNKKAPVERRRLS